MKKSLKLFTVMIVLCFLALPAASFAAYDSLYANAADSIFSDGSWTGIEENTVSGADYSYHVWYDVGGVRADYYMASYDTYTTEWLTYDGTAGDESWLYTAAADGSYQAAQENFDYADYDLSYWLYDGGSTYKMKYDFDSVDGSYAGWFDYSVDIETQASGYYLYDYSYSSHNLSWDSTLENDVSNAQYYEQKSLYDPINGQQSEEYNWKSTATGSYMNFAYTAMGTATSTGTGWDSWSWDDSEETYNYSTFSADYSSFLSGYAKATYSDAGDTYWFQWDWKITDTAYFGNGWSWDDGVNNNSEIYYESLSQDSGQDYYEKYYGKDTKDTSYYSSYYEYRGSGEWSQEESWTDDSTHWYVNNNSSYTPEDGETYTEAYYKFNDGNKFWYQDVESYKYDSGAWENDTTVFFSDYTGLGDYRAGTGSYDYVSYGYDSDIQEQWYDKTYYDFVGRPGTSYYYDNQVYQYTYNEWYLTDSDEKHVSWNEYTRDPSSTPTYYYTPYDTLTNEGYNYSLRSDTGDESWSYSYDDLTGANNTYYDASHWENVYVAGVYDDSVTYRVNGVSYYSKDEGQDLDYYWQSTESDGAGSYGTSSDYKLNLASGAQIWDSAYRNSSLGTWSHAILFNLNGTAWTGDRTVYDGSAYDLYYYSAYPDDYFLAADQSYIPDIMPGYPSFYY